jgi:hypothetical protein
MATSEQTDFSPESRESRIKQSRRGIYLIANERSAAECYNLIYSIRQSGCGLPIRVIPYGGQPLRLRIPVEGVQLLSISDFPREGQQFLEELEKRIPQCSPGLLRRFLAWFGEFEEFLYSDNDVVALMNWEELFPFLDHYEIVHADREYLTGGIFNASRPAVFEDLLGPGALEKAMTAGHFLCRRSSRHTIDLLEALAWMEAHPDIPKWHDQALLHITLARAKWRALNLCKPPYSWASSWAGDYKNALDLLQTVQAAHQPISHIHYSGGVATGAKPIEELLFSRFTTTQRNRRLLWVLVREVSGLNAMRNLAARAKRKVTRSITFKYPLNETDHLI